MTEGSPAPDIQAVLNLDQVSRGTFVAAPVRTVRSRVFGGQVAAQALLAAARTTSADRMPHSLHASFLRPGDPRLPISYSVEQLSDGRSFSVRRVTTRQAGTVIFSASISFQVPEEGLEHHDPMPALPGPDGLPEMRELLANIGILEGKVWHELPSISTRVVFVGEDGAPAPHPGDTGGSAVWFRVTCPLPDDPLLHTALVALLPDLTLLAGSLLPHRLRMTDPSMQTASLDHTLWFHQPARVDEWSLLTMHSPWAGRARGMTTGSLYAHSGELLASATQQGLIRRLSSGAAGAGSEDTPMV